MIPQTGDGAHAPFQRLPTAAVRPVLPVLLVLSPLLLLTVLAGLVACRVARGKAERPYS